MTTPEAKHTVLEKSHELISGIQNLDEGLIYSELKRSGIEEGNYVPRMYNKRTKRLIFYFYEKDLNWSDAYPKIQGFVQGFVGVSVSTILVSPTSIDEWVNISYEKQALMSVGRTRLIPTPPLITEEEARETEPYSFMSVNMGLYAIHKKLIEGLFFGIGERVIGVKR